MQSRPLYGILFAATLLGGVALHLTIRSPGTCWSGILLADALGLLALIALWPYHDLVGWRRLTASFDRWVESRTPLPVVVCDQQAVTVTGLQSADLRFAWSEVVRIGYRTRDALVDDHLLEFHLEDGRQLGLPTGWPGMQALCDRVAALPDTRFDERGALANVVGNASVVIWPATEAGGSLDQREGGPRSR